jgi:hypothetical protein
MAVVPISIGVAVVRGEFEIEAKAEPIRRWPDSDVISELGIPSQSIESEKRGRMYACIIKVVDATPEAKPRKRVTDLNITLYLCHIGNLARFCIVPRNHRRLWRK